MTSNLQQTEYLQLRFRAYRKGKRYTINTHEGKSLKIDTNRSVIAVRYYLILANWPFSTDLKHFKKTLLEKSIQMPLKRPCNGKQLS